MRPASAKAKGRRLQNEVADAFRGLFPKLELGDIRPAVMGESGTDIKLSPLAERFIPFDTEAKCQERLNIWTALAQAAANTRPGRMPLLVFRRNRSETYATLRLDDLLTILRDLHEFASDERLHHR